MSRPACLVESHWADLQRSGLSVETVLANRIHSGSPAEVSEILRWGNGAGMVIPYPTVNGGPAFARVRIDHPSSDGKRYRSPKDSRNRLYIPATLDAKLLGDVSTPVYITEGEKKCLKAVQSGLCCIGLAGVWSWRGTDEHGKKGPLADFDAIPFAGRTVYIVFDSDLVAKPDVRAAEDGLAAELTRRGAVVYRIPLPPGPDGTKVGLDDFLVAHSVATFRAIEPVRLPEASPTVISFTPIGEILGRDRATLQTKYIVTPWVPTGLCAVSAKAGTGKSKLIADLCIARASCGRWLGLLVAPGPALYWSGEQGANEDARVTQGLCRGRAIDAKAFAHYFAVVHDPPVRFGHPTMFAEVMERLQEHPGLLIGIDSQRRAFEGDESDSSAADEFYRTVLAPLRAAGATVVTLAHPPKTSGQQKSIADENMIRGSGDWLAQLDSFMGVAQGDAGRLRIGRERQPVRHHMKKLRGVDSAVANFFASGLLEFPPAMPFDIARFAVFLARLPRSTAEAARLARRHDERVRGRCCLTPRHDAPIRHAVEVRHEAFFAPAFRELLERHDVAFVISDGAGRWPMGSFVTASFAYVRLHASEELYVSGYRPEELDRWASTCAGLAAQGLEVFVYFDNDAKVHAPADAEGLMRRLGIALPAHPLPSILGCAPERPGGPDRIGAARHDPRWQRRSLSPSARSASCPR